MANGPSRQMRGAGNFGEQLVQFKLADAQRIANAVSQVEGARRGRKGSTLPRAAGGGAGVSVEFGTFTGGWVKNSYKTITITPANTTATAFNSFSDIASYSQARRCAVVRYSGEGPSGNSNEYVMIAAECF